ncbi:MAG: hypothetical protein HY692_04375 [Cyanobacteria bacterium NC_groundwater_1444_Ag_S-0.65um_54_12]|nr:hypothetical protein [Cyanobacteria bacterium NC_groundwater_1444_Ag_S-0.65um_54_12]
MTCLVTGTASKLEREVAIVIWKQGAIAVAIATMVGCGSSPVLTGMPTNISPETNLAVPPEDASTEPRGDLPSEELKGQVPPKLSPKEAERLITEEPAATESQAVTDQELGIPGEVSAAPTRQVQQLGRGGRGGGWGGRWGGGGWRGGGWGRWHPSYWRYWSAYPTFRGFYPVVYGGSSAYVPYCIESTTGELVPCIDGGYLTY